MSETITYTTRPRKVLPDRIRGFANFPTDLPDERRLLGEGWLRRGDIATFISTAGAGKSVGMCQAAMAWGLGLPYFGIAPARPLRITMFSGEDDDFTIGQCREGLIEHAVEVTGREITRAEVDDLDDRLVTDFQRTHTGMCFHKHLAEALVDHESDLVIINPLLSYIGGEIVAEASQWLRAGLMPLLKEFDCAAIVCSHTNKMQKDSWNNTLDAYSGIGGSEMANVPRSVLTLRPTKCENIHVLKSAKRTSTGWKDDRGLPSNAYYVKRTARADRPAWLPVTHAEAREAQEKVASESGPQKKATREDVLQILEEGAMSRQGLIEALREQCGCGMGKAVEAIAEARRDLHAWEKQSEGRGRPQVWFCLPKDAAEHDPEALPLGGI